MKFYQSLCSWWKNLFRKRRFNMLNATDSSEEWHMHLSPASIFAGFVSFALLIFVLILSLVAYSPVLELLPGYRTEADRARENLGQNIIRLDSMERMMNDMLTYNQNITMILSGKNPTVRTIVNQDSTRTVKMLVMPSPEDSILRAQMEGSGEYALAGRNSDLRRTLRESIELTKPVEGIILDHFDLKNEQFGVSIAAAANDRITAIENGTVILNIWTPATGYIVQLQHPNNLVSIYKGLSQALIPTGQTIRAGELLGYNSSLEEGAVRPFEFELWNNGKPVDPEAYILF